MNKWYRLTNREQVIIFLLLLDIFVWILSLNMRSFRGHLVLFIVGLAAFCAAIWLIVFLLMDHYRYRNM